VRNASDLVISVKPHSLSIIEDDRFVLSFDRAGRLYTAYREGRTFVRGLSGTVVEKWHERGEPWAPKQVRVLAEEEKRAFLTQLWSDVQTTITAFRRGGARVQFFGGGVSESDLDRWLERLLAWDVQAYARDEERFRSVYKPVSILPPDQYLALVLQVTEGCHWNKCTFCDFYRDRRFRIKTDEEVRRHIAAVKEFLGDSITLRRSLFLADANALIIPQEWLLRILEIIHESFIFDERRVEGAFEGIYSFLDAYSGMRRTAEDFAALRERRVKRLYLGVESGHDELLRFVNKPGTAREALEVVSRIKAAGLAVGVIILIGLGGEAFFDSHVRETIALLNEMPLGREDIIYLSPLYIHPGSDYEEKARAFRIRALAPHELKRQIHLIREGLRFASSVERPRISIYDVREFVY
jgi:hypothetical protein